MSNITPIKPQIINHSAEEVDFTYLQLQLNVNIVAVLPMKYAIEAINISSRRITPMPNMPNCILGLLNQKSHIFWVADLAQILKMHPLERNLQQYHVVIIRVQDIPLGLIVSQIKGTIRLSESEIQSPKGKVIPTLEPYLQGYCQQKDKNILVLNLEAIINSPMLHPTFN